MPIFSVAIGAIACGGSVGDSTKPSPDVECAVPPGGLFGDGVLDGALETVRVMTGAQQDARANIDSDIAALAATYGIAPSDPGAAVTMKHLVTAIDDDLAMNTQGGLRATGTDVVCTPSDTASALARAACERTEGCEQGAVCEARNRCADMARIRGLASMTCTEPLLTVEFTPLPGISVSEEAALTARIEDLRTHGARILSNATLVSALVTGKTNGAQVFDPTPAMELKSELIGFADAGTPVRLPAHCAAYAVSALNGAAHDLGVLGTEGVSVAQDGEDLASVF